MWRLICLLIILVGCADTYTMYPITNSGRLERAEPSYTKYTKTVCNGDVCSLVVYTTQKYGLEDRQWKKVEDMRSLRGTDYQCTVEVDSATDPIVECVDWNLSSVKIRVNDKKEWKGEVRIVDKVSSNEIRKSTRNTLQTDHTIRLEKDEVLHLGKSSTTVSISPAGDTSDGNCDYDDTASLRTWSTSGDLYVGKDGYVSDNFDYLGIVFPSVTVPQGATILSSYLGLSSVSTFGPGNRLTKIYFEDADDSSPFTSSEDDCADFLSRTKTSAAIDWDITSGITQSRYYWSPNISSVVQEVVDRGSWSSGNNMTVLHYDDGSQNYQTFRAYDDGSGYEPILNITYASAAAEDSCTEEGDGTWEINMSHNCNITSTSTDVISFVGEADGYTNFTVDFNMSGNLPANTTLWLGDDVTVTKVS